MYDSKWIIIGLVVLLALISFPFTYVLATGEAGHAPKLAPAKGEECIEPKGWMRANHQHLLNDWRYSVFREGNRTYVASDGEEYEINFMTCFINCHSKQQFCDQCHNYVGVKPSCWDCHVAPEEK